MLVPLLWATFIACAKLLYLLPVALSPATFNGLRLVVSSLFFLPILVCDFRPRARPLPRLRTRALPRHVAAGLELGALMFAAIISQIAGLAYTGASRAAFLNQLSTVLVPLSLAAFGIEALLTLGGSTSPAALAAAAPSPCPATASRSPPPPSPCSATASRSPPLSSTPSSSSASRTTHAR